MKKNNKGFMLVEVIVTSTVIVTAMIGLYSSFNKLYINYNIKNSYYDIDALYATKTMFNEFLNKNDVNSVISNIFDNANFGYLIQNGECKDVVSICENIKSLYKVKNMIIIEYDKEILMKFKTENLNETFKEYIDYVISYYGVLSEDNEYSYLLLTELENNNTYGYANMRVR